MSKLYEKYLFLKGNEEDSDETLFLFKSGIFFIFLDADAKIASQILNLKLTHLTEKIVKCGFPINALNKYKTLLGQTTYKLKIIDNSTNTAYTLNNYFINEDINSLLLKISTIDSDSLSIKEAYTFIDDIKNSAKLILRR